MGERNTACSLFEPFSSLRQLVSGERNSTIGAVNLLKEPTLQSAAKGVGGCCCYRCRLSPISQRTPSPTPIIQAAIIHKGDRGRAYGGHMVYSDPISKGSAYVWFENEALPEAQAIRQQIRGNS